MKKPNSLPKFDIEGLDMRAIGFFRIALGLLLLWNFFYYKVMCFVTIYAPENGFLGNIYMDRISVPQSLWSPLNSIDSNFFMLLCYLLYFTMIVLFTIGKGKKIPALLILFFLWSFNQRFYPVYFGWDLYLQVLVFMALILPVNSIYTIGSDSKKFSRQQLEFKSPIVFVVLVQISCIYFFNAYNKFGHTWLDGSAAKFIMQDAMIGKPFAELFVNNDAFITFFTYATLIFEYAIPFLLFFPLYNKKTRMVAIFSILFFHWGIAFFANVGHFKFCGTVACILLLPSYVWDKLGIGTTENPSKELTVNTVSKQFIAVISAFLIMIILNQNLANAIAFRSKHKEIEKFSNLQNVIKRLKIKSPEFTSLLNQSWTLYAPNPMDMTGLLDIEFISDNQQDTISGLSLSNIPSDPLTKRGNSYDLRNQFLAVKRKELSDPQKAEFIDLLINNVIASFDKDEKERFHYLEIVYYNKDAKGTERAIWANAQFQ